MKYIWIWLMAGMLLSSCSKTTQDESSSKDTEPSVTVVKSSSLTNEQGRFSPDGDFVYNYQLASFKSNLVKSQGECDADSFMDFFRSFDWGSQIEEANKLRRASPSLGLRHNPSDYELGITGVGNHKDDFGFWLYYGSFGDMKSIEVMDEASVEKYIRRFFDKDFIALSEEFHKQK